jgi:hypothetical protein
MKTLTMILTAVCLTGCAKQWAIRQEPITPEERLCVARQEVAILSSAVHDSAVRGWDDAIKAAHESACKSCVPLRLWEYDTGTSQWTGETKPVSRD